MEFSTLKNLQKEIKRLRKIGARSLLLQLTIDFHHKIAEPFTPFFLILGIIPLALEIKKRKATLSSLAVGFIFGAIYYGFDSFSVALGKAGILLPLCAAWLAPLFFLTVGISGIILLR